MKKTIIISSVLIGIIGLIAILFGFVFCLRDQRVIVVGEDINYSTEDIISTAGLKTGSPIFMLDKATAIDKIETEFINIKVIQIVTTSPFSVDIRVCSRYKTYYVEYGDDYYALDEELKVLDVVDEEPLELIKLNIDIEKVYREGDFILSTNASLMNSLYEGIYTTTLESEGRQSHLDMCELVESISFDKDYTLTGEYSRLIITLRSGVILDIGKPDTELERKLNICFTYMEENAIASGRLRAYYDANDNESFLKIDN